MKSIRCVFIFAAIVTLSSAAAMAQVSKFSASCLEALSPVSGVPLPLVFQDFAGWKFTWDGKAISREADVKAGKKVPGVPRETWNLKKLNEVDEGRVSSTVAFQVNRSVRFFLGRELHGLSKNLPSAAQAKAVDQALGICEASKDVVTIDAVTPNLNNKFSTVGDIARNLRAKIRRISPKASAPRR
jgi:hypothetical protein